ncbi:GyrI-like domain-containing protein [Nocardioides sp.]|uniref:GyrI-like domain-containing protein n=1 Tax=Nocardioides sp. TaxID=35761 RepID=UPI002613788C|nr:GyrI-like domain-containing protein [Nocardioides sp.]MCW2736807.1 transcriptional regulator [Nocardioides sp.]
MTYAVQLVEVRSQPAAVVRAHVRPEDIAGFLGGAFAEVMTVLGHQGLSPTGPPFSRYVVSKGGFEVETGFPASRAVEASGRVVPSELPAGTAATTVHSGAYEQVGGAYSAATTWLADHRFVASGPPWESYLDGPDVAEPRTEVFVPCRPEASEDGG